MKQVIRLSLAATLLVLPYSSAFSVSEVTLDEIVQIEGASLTDTIFESEQVQFVFRLTNSESSPIDGLCNGFRVWTYRNGTYTNNFNPITYDTLSVGIINWLDGGFFFGPFSIDGLGEDTVRFGGFALYEAGLPLGFDEQVWWIGTEGLVAGDTICVDSSFAPPGCDWRWSLGPPADSFFIPNWDGPYCFVVSSCCRGDRGNVDLQVGPGGPTDVADLNMLVAYVFPPHDPLPCSTVGDVDGLSYGGVAVNVADVTYLVSYLFGGGPAPPPCP